MPSPRLLLLLTLLLSSSHPTTADHVPLRYKINQKQTECIYEHFPSGDFVTFSVFVVEALMNGKPLVAISYEGPIAGNPTILQKDTTTPPAVSLGREIRTSLQKEWPRAKDADKARKYNERLGILNRQLKIDWTHAGESEDAAAARSELERKQAQEFQKIAKKYAESSVEERERNLPTRIMVQSKIEPYEETRAIKLEGWYRLCISGGYHPLIVEMDMRSSIQMGGFDEGTGNVYTFDKKMQMEEQKLIDSGITSLEERQLDANTYSTSEEEREKELKNQVKEEDLEATKEQIKILHQVTSEMMTMQHQHRHRLKSHEGSAKRNHDEMVRSSIVETVLFALITGYQVYTVRKWLLSNSLLGK